MVNRLTLVYVAAVILGVISFVVLMVFLNWNLNAFTNPTLLFIPTLFSGFTMKILGGLGIAANYAVICQLFFRAFSGSLKGRKGRVRALKAVLLVFAVLVCTYYVYRVYAVYFLSHPETLIDLILNIYGAISLMLWVYIVPAIRGSYGGEEKGVLHRIRERLGGVRYSIWKGYRYRVRRDYGTVFAAEYQRLQWNLEGIRGQLSGLLLLPLAFILLLFPPLMAVVLVLWARLFSLNKTPLTRGERLLLCIVSAGILIMSLFINLSLNMPIMTIYFDLAYGFGVLAGVFLLGYLVLKS